jgi:hypothetical protein
MVPRGDHRLNEPVVAAGGVDGHAPSTPKPRHFQKEFRKAWKFQALRMFTRFVKFEKLFSPTPRCDPSARGTPQRVSWST